MIAICLCAYKILYDYFLRIIMTAEFFPGNQLPVEVKGRDVAVVTAEMMKQEVDNQEHFDQVRNFMNLDSNAETDIKKVSSHFVEETMIKAVARYREEKGHFLHETNSKNQNGNTIEESDRNNNPGTELAKQTMMNVTTNKDNTGNIETGTRMSDKTCLTEVKVIVHNEEVKEENCTNNELKPKFEQGDIQESENIVDKKWPLLTIILPEYTYKLLPKVKVLSGFVPACANMIYGICPIGDGGAWISFYHSHMVTLVDSCGTIHQVVSHSTAITDISVAPRTQDILTSAQGQYPWISPQGQNLLTLPEVPRPLTPVDEQEFWTAPKKNRYSWNVQNTKHEQHLWLCSSENLSVWECCTCTSSETPVLRFKTELSPRSLCATMDGHIIVGMDQILTKFTKEGKPLFSTKDFQVGNNSLVYSPSKITECPVTQNIAVLDRNWSVEEQQYRSYILVMDLEFQEVFRYKGQGVAPNHRQSFRRGQYRFDPVDIKYDSIGNLVIGDRQGRNLQLFLINGEGQLTNLLHTDTLPTQALGIERRNILWAAFSDYNKKHIKILQYSN